jgi:hypothetical protein
MMDTMAHALIKAIQDAGGDLPEVCYWACKDGGIRKLTMDFADPRCDECDCGYADLMNGALNGKDSE